MRYSHDFERKNSNGQQFKMEVEVKGRLASGKKRAAVGKASWDLAAIWKCSGLVTEFKVDIFFSCRIICFFKKLCMFGV